VEDAVIVHGSYERVEVFVTVVDVERGKIRSVVIVNGYTV